MTSINTINSCSFFLFMCLSLPFLCLFIIINNSYSRLNIYPLKYLYNIYLSDYLEIVLQIRNLCQAQSVESAQYNRGVRNTSSN